MINSAKEIVIKKAFSPLSKAEAAYQLLLKAEDTMIGKMLISTAFNSVNSLINNSKERLPCVTKESIASLSGGSGIEFPP
jgi:hypothetical protein